MGVFMCSETHYDIETEAQGVVFAISHGLYDILEMAFIYYTIRLIRNESTSWVSLEMIVFLVAMHIALLRVALYFILGVFICCNETLYSVIASYGYLFRKVAFMALTIRIAAMARALRLKRFPIPAIETFMWIYTCLDVICYSLLYFFESQHVGESVSNRLWYSLATGLFQLGLFIYFSCLLATALAEPTAKTDSLQSFELVIVILIMSLSFAARLMHASFRLGYEDTIQKLYRTQVGYSIYLVLLFFLTDFVPCYLMIKIIIKAQIQDTTQRSLSRASAINS